MAEVFAYTSIEKVTVTGASNLPDSIFDYSESDWYSKTLWYVTKAKVVELREGNHIDPYMFKNCSDLQTVILAPSMGTIESYAFYGCNSLKTIDLSNVSSIGVYAFAHSGVKTIVLSGSMGQLKDSVFENCTSLVNVTLPESLTAIGQRTFYGCVRLDAISIPKSVMSIGTDAFKGCTGLRQLTVQDGYYADRFKDSVDIDVDFDGFLDVRDLDFQMFSDCFHGFLLSLD